jgi:hypothetical protein
MKAIFRSTPLFLLATLTFAEPPAVFLDLGVNYPDGLFSNTVYEGFSLNAGLEVPVFHNLSVERNPGQSPSPHHLQLA